MSTSPAATNVSLMQRTQSVQVGKDGHGTGARIMKPTRFMSNSVHMLKRLHRTCQGGHSHQPLLGGRAASAAFYPLPLLKAILQGITDTEHANDSLVTMSKDEYEVSLVLSVNDARFSADDAGSLAPGEMPVEGGGTVRINYSLGDFRETYLDEYTREPLPQELVRQAIREELEYFNARVWELSGAKAVMQNKDAKTIRTRWVISNTGDLSHPGIRARLVAQEVNTYTTDECFASTPPLECNRLLLSHLASQRKLADGRALEASFIDIKNVISTAYAVGDSICFSRGRWVAKKEQWRT